MRNYVRWSQKYFHCGNEICVNVPLMLHLDTLTLYNRPISGQLNCHVMIRNCVQFYVKVFWQYNSVTFINRYYTMNRQECTYNKKTVVKLACAWLLATTLLFISTISCNMRRFLFQPTYCLWLFQCRFIDSHEKHVALLTQ